MRGVDEFIGGRRCEHVNLSILELREAIVRGGREIARIRREGGRVERNYAAMIVPIRIAGFGGFGAITEA